ncbi:hypothetical protein OB920_15770 [Halobacteria archaeon HArc-gm2]|nr:hypothetical protein [Halobacteria archaeon HArc-gm2]
MHDWVDPGETLDPGSFERLYRGALGLESDVERSRAATLVLLTGRLGLTLEEALHCNEGWIDWERAEIRVPEKDPCACAGCWELARRRREHTDPIREVLYEECWSPSPDRAPRTVPFGWSRRISAALLATADRYLLDLLPDDASELLRAAGEAADGIEPDDLTPGLLAATTADFLSDLGLEADGTATVLGVEEAQVEPYAADGESDVTTRMARLAGVDGSADPESTFPAACGTEAYESEPFDVAAADADALAERATATDAPERVPRPTDLPASVDYDPADHAAAGGPNRRTDAGSWAEGPSAADASENAIRADGASAVAGADRGRAGLPDDPSATSGGQATAPDVTCARDVVTQPVVADFSTRVAADGLCGGREIPGRVILGQEELFVLWSEEKGAEDADAPHLLVPLDDVWDVRIDDVPGRLSASFPHAVTVGHRPSGRDELAVSIQLPPVQRRDMASALYRILLNVTPMTVVDPAREGGRVTDADPAEMVLYVRPHGVAFTDEAGDAARLAFDLADVVDVERIERSFDGESRPAIQLRRVTDNRPVTTVVTAADDRLRRLVWRYVRREYHQTLATVRGIRLSDAEKMVMVALYSTDGTPDLGSLLDLTGQELAAALQSLAAKELVRSADAATELTGTGQLAVSDRLESVND